ncbi:hypothetical protein B0T25DRAFT_110808 [Lasiosphaeria hispida]|uniref:Uncharacterized protein n=1 Tax=Lasiosphaeria hispida TaxID=260671 RepID=A0AAJ0MI56_9PEZI|nr:hypothetical protein B0T25DRAFT_110808 [Lasiosphaeria hispida]
MAVLTPVRLLDAVVGQPVVVMTFVSRSPVFRAPRNTLQYTAPLPISTPACCCFFCPPANFMFGGVQPLLTLCQSRGVYQPCYDSNPLRADRVPILQIEPSNPSSRVVGHEARPIPRRNNRQPTQFDAFSLPCFPRPTRRGRTLYSLPGTPGLQNRAFLTFPAIALPSTTPPANRRQDCPSPQKAPSTNPKPEFFLQPSDRR